MREDFEYDIFFSYSSEDKETVHALAERLRKDGLRVWLDKWAIQPGDQIPSKIVEGLEQSRKLLMCMTSNYFKSEYGKTESYARFHLDPTNAKRRFVPLLIEDCTRPAIIAQYSYIDWRTHSEEAYSKLIEACMGVQVGIMKLTDQKKQFYVPELPSDDVYLPRLICIEQIKEDLIDKSSPRIIGLWGMGGIGKSVIAAAIARDDNIGETFVNGIIWLNIGNNPNLIDKQLDLAGALGAKGLKIKDPYADGMRSLTDLLDRKTCLIILDNVWDANDAKAFIIAGERSKILITTRKIEVLNKIGAKEYGLDLLSNDESKKILAKYSGQEPETLPEEAQGVIETCGRLPLALAMVGSMAKRKPYLWGNIFNKLKNDKLATIHANFPCEYDNLNEALEVSFEDLESDHKECYLDMAIFQDNTPISRTVLQTLWYPEFTEENQDETQDKMEEFADRSLGQIIDEGNRLKLHDLQWDYVRSKVGKCDLKGRHNKIIRSYNKRCKKANDWSTGPNDGYFFQNLFYHLNGSVMKDEEKMKDEIKKLMFDFSWLDAKLKNTDFAALIADFSFIKADKEVELCQNALRLSARVLSKDGDQLAGQLLGRLLNNRKYSMINHLMHEAKGWDQHVWLRPVKATLIRPDRRLLSSLAGHEGWVRAVATTTDGKRAISTSDDHLIKIWDLEKGTVLRTLQGHWASVNAVVLTADGKKAISASDDLTLMIWNLESEDDPKILSGHSAAVNAIVLTPDEKRAISASSDKTLKIWDLDTGQALNTLQGHTDSVNSVAIYLDGRRAISASDDKSLRIWDLDHEEEIKPPLTGHEASVRGVAITPDGKNAISASDDMTIRIWDLESHNVQVIKGHKAPVNAVALEPRSNKIVSASNDRTIKIWYLNGEKEIKTLSGHGSSVRSLAVIPNGKKLISASDDRSLKIWDFDTGNELQSLRGHGAPIRAVTITADGKHAISASDDRIFRKWNLETGKLIMSHSGHGGPIRAITITPDGSKMISASDDGTLKVWDLKSWKKLNTLKGHLGSVRAVAITPDGNKVISASEDTNLKVWDLKTGRDIMTLEGHTNWVRTVAITPDGKKAISASNDLNLKIWDLETGREIQNLPERNQTGHEISVNTVTISPDGMYLASGSDDKTLKIWDLKRGGKPRTLEGHEKWVNAILFTPDGKEVISASGDGTLKIWNIMDGSHVNAFSGDSSIYAFAYSAKMKTVVAGEASGRLHFLVLERPDINK